MSARLDAVRKIAVLRPNAVGDFVFALPALHALKHSYPEAEIVLLGKTWHADFLRGRPGPVDRVIVLPPVPGVGAPPGAACDEREIEHFAGTMRDEGFDIALQMFGAGCYSNPFLLRLGARLSVGAPADGAAALDRWMPYCEPNNRRLALLEIAALAGAWPGPLPLPELAVTAADRAEAEAALPRAAHERLVALSPQTRCPVCGQENIRTRCAHDDSFVAEVGVEEVERLARSLLAGAHRAYQ